MPFSLKADVGTSLKIQREGTYNSTIIKLILSIFDREKHPNGLIRKLKAAMAVIKQMRDWIPSNS